MDKIVSDVGASSGMAEHLHKCPHVEKHCVVKWKKVSELPELTKECEEKSCKEKETWICLSCGINLCGRWAKKHFLEHQSSTGHAIALGTSDLSFWCYPCNGYLDVAKFPRLNQLYSLFHTQAFGAPPPGDAQSIGLLEGMVKPPAGAPPKKKQKKANASLSETKGKIKEYNEDETTDPGSLSGAARHLHRCPHLQHNGRLTDQQGRPVPHGFSPRCVDFNSLVPLDRRCEAQCSADGQHGQGTCGNERENWICLTCDKVLCGRWAGQHMLQHFQETGHAHALGTGDLSFWCYGCDSYLNVGSFPLLHKIYSLYHVLCFGAAPPGAPESITQLVDQGILEASGRAHEHPAEQAAAGASGSEALDLGSWQQVHGTRGKSEWAAPRMVAKASVINRPDQRSRIMAHEYEDHKQVLRDKMKLVADLLRQSKRAVVYTGAGLSRSAGIADYASQADRSVVQTKTLPSPFDAEPSFAHRVLVALERKGLVATYVQQNHDGLPQKAGFPQAKMNEIHGAWYDVSNPVVPMDGKLRHDLFAALLETERTGDLCLCLGTSMSGMNSDRVATTIGRRAKASTDGKEAVLGTVIINLQQVSMDRREREVAVRVWAQLDEAFQLLAEELGLDVPPTLATLKVPRQHARGSDVFGALPYSASGKKDAAGALTLDLRTGASVLVVEPYAANKGAHGEVIGKDQFGNYMIEMRQWHGETRTMRLGWWWIQSALQGDVAQLPIVNAPSSQEGEQADEQEEGEQDEQEDKQAKPGPSSSSSSSSLPSSSSSSDSSRCSIS